MAAGSTVDRPAHPGDEAGPGTPGAARPWGRCEDEAERPSRAGRLVIIGGNEDREHEKRVLRRFVELAGGAAARIVVLTASGPGDEGLLAQYEQAFASLGVAQCVGLDLAAREEGNDPRSADRLLSADGLFLTGGDAQRLLAVIGGTAVHQALGSAWRQGGKCLGATSAAASTLAQQVMQEGRLGAGLGLLQRVLIDQHFSERQRLGRLLQTVAQHPTLLGVGIDEDTALVIEPCGGVEVVGDGAVTLLDGRQMSSNVLPGRERGALELIDVKLHLLPAGTHYACADPVDRQPRRVGRWGEPRAVPPALQEILSLLTRPGAS